MTVFLDRGSADPDTIADVQQFAINNQYPWAWLGEGIEPVYGDIVVIDMPTFPEGVRVKTPQQIAEAMTHTRKAN